MPDGSKRVVAVPGLGDSSGFAYAQCVTAGNLVFVAGQTGVDERYRVVSADFEPQARQAFENVRLALEAAGSGLDHIVSMTVFLTDMRHFHEFTEVRREVLGAALSASAVIGVSHLAMPGLLVEIQATGIIPA